MDELEVKYRAKTFGFRSEALAFMDRIKNAGYEPHLGSEPGALYLVYWQGCDENQF